MTHSSTDALGPTAPIVVTGMHCSGTSLVASVLYGAGVNMGDRLLPADAHNRAGYFEDVDFLDLQGRMMAASTPQDEQGHPDWGWTERSTLDPRKLDAFREEAEALIRGRVAEGRPWGWKNPRTAVTLGFWASLLPQATFVFTYRPPWEVADSMQRLGAPVFLRHPDYAYAIWAFYNREILQFLRSAPDRCVLVSANRVVAEPARLDRVLRDRLGLAVAEDQAQRTVRRELFKAQAGHDPLVTLLAGVAPERLELLAELDALADLSEAGCWGGIPRRSWVAGGGPPPRVSVLSPCRNHGELLLEAVASAERAAAVEPLEVVIVDDGSDEPWTRKVLDGLAGLGYQVLRQPHGGLSAGRNRAAAAAVGDILLPLDADDRLQPWFPRAAREAIDADPAVGVVYSDFQAFGLSNETVSVPEFEVDRLLAGNYIAACACLRRQVWEACGGWDTAITAWEDWELWLAAAERGWKFEHLPRVGFEYRRRPDSLVSTCLSPVVGRRLQQHIVSKHSRLYVEHLPALLLRVQDSARAAAASRDDAAAARLAADQSAGDAAAVREAYRELEARLGAAWQEKDELALARARLEVERDELYDELGRWHVRASRAEKSLAAMEKTTVWRWQLRAVAARKWLAGLIGR